MNHSKPNKNPLRQTIISTRRYEFERNQNKEKKVSNVRAQFPGQNVILFLCKLNKLN